MTWPNERQVTHGVLQKMVLDALRDVGPMTSRELAAHTGRTDLVIGEVMRRLRAKCLTHVTAWQTRTGTGGGRRAAVHALGDLPDAIEPPAVSSKMRNKAYRQRHAARLRAQDAAARRKAGMELTGVASAGSMWAGLVR